MKRKPITRSYPKVKPKCSISRCGWDDVMPTRIQGKRYCRHHVQRLHARRSDTSC